MRQKNNSQQDLLYVPAGFFLFMLFPRFILRRNSGSVNL